MRVVVADLHAAELRQVELRPFYVRLTFNLLRAALAVGRAPERSGH